MSDERKDSGSAFPFTGVTGQYPQDGMSLRDYFAAKAIGAVLGIGFTAEGAEAMAEEAKSFNVEVVDYQAQMAYQIADAMLKARQS